MDGPEERVSILPWNKPDSNDWFGWLPFGKKVVVGEEGIDWFWKIPVGEFSVDVLGKKVSSIVTMSVAERSKAEEMESSSRDEVWSEVSTGLGLAAGRVICDSILSTCTLISGLAYENWGLFHTLLVYGIEMSTESTYGECRTWETWV